MKTLITQGSLVLCLLALGGLPLQSEDDNMRKRQVEGDLRVSLDASDEPLKEVLRDIAQQVGKTITLGADVDGQVTAEITNLDWIDALQAIVTPLDLYVIQHNSDWVEVVRPALVTFTTGPEGADIKDVISAIAEFSGTSVVVSPQVSGVIHVRLEGVPWRAALETAVRRAGDYIVVKEDFNVLSVVPTALLANQVETRVFPLRYITPPPTFIATMATVFATGDFEGTGFPALEAIQAMLTENGRMQFDVENRAFIVTDIRPVLDRVEELLVSLDAPVRQVVVEVNVVSTRDTDTIDIGVDFGDSGPVVSMTGGSMFHRLPFDFGDGGFEDSIGFADAGVNPLDGSGAIPSRVAPASITEPFSFGQLDFGGVQAVLRFLRRDVKSRITQQPRLVIMDNHRSTIFSGETIRYAETRAQSAQDGGLTFVLGEASGSPVQVGFQLYVTAHIVPGSDRVILEVVPTFDSLTGSSSTNPGFDSFSNGTQTIDLPRVSSQTVVTEVMVESGETAMIGGLMAVTDSQETTKLPFLGDIPFLGYLFKNNTRTKVLQNLTIFITPVIIDPADRTHSFHEDKLETRRQQARQRWIQEIQSQPESMVK